MRRLPAHWLLLAPGLLVLTALFLIPVGQLAVFSVFRNQPGAGMQPALILGNYLRFLSDPHYLRVLLRTLTMGAEVSLICLLLGYALAYGAARSGPRWRTFLLLMAVLPLMTSAVVRSFGWMVLLGRKGLINHTLLTLGLIQEPLNLLHTPTGVVIALVHVLLPFMVLVLYAVIEGIDRRVEEAAASLGASPPAVFLLVTLPLSLPGIAAGTLLVFSLAISSFITPALVGGPKVQVMATEIYDQTVQLLDWPFASAIAVILLVTVLLVMALYGRALHRSQRDGAQGGLV